MDESVLRECVKYLAFIGLIALPIGALLPRELFHYDRFPFRLMKWERGGQAYEKLHIRAWKDKMPDMSRFCGFLVKKKVDAGIHAIQVERLIQETCVAELTHTVLIMLGFRCVLVGQNAAGFVLTALWSISNLLYIVIQRYNRPVLLKLADMLHRRERVILYQEDSHTHGEFYSSGHSV